MAFCVSLNASDLQLCDTITSILSSVLDLSAFKHTEEHKGEIQVLVLGEQIQWKSKHMNVYIYK